MVKVSNDHDSANVAIHARMAILIGNRSSKASGITMIAISKVIRRDDGRGLRLWKLKSDVHSILARFGILTIMPIRIIAASASLPSK